MCRIGDIIVIEKYMSHGIGLGRHSFVVLDDTDGDIEGVPYDFISLVMSSFKNDQQKQHKMRYPGNFPIVSDDVDIENGNERDGYIKADQLYFFNKSKTQYKVIGTISVEIFNLLIDFIKELEEQGIEFERITDNL